MNVPNEPKLFVCILIYHNSLYLSSFAPAVNIACTLSAEASGENEKALGKGPFIFPPAPAVGP